ncbi:MAG TPA: hypothetical protein VHX36_01630 [Candidatus Acidoferrales bacterium]|jgi:hypothetical protein|nr:hypothetical protein [Candidatus Acidoferrales bacterium]
MKPGIWLSIGRWILVLPAFVLGLAIAIYFVFVLSVVFEITLLGWAQSLHLPPGPVLGFLDLAFVFLALALWTTATVFAIGFALHSDKLDLLLWGLTCALFLAAGWVWAIHSSGLVRLSHLVSVIAGAILILGIAASFRLRHRRRLRLVGNVAALLTLTLPCLVAYARFPKLPPKAQRLWSTVLQKGTWQAMNTGSSFNSTRQVVISGDRAVAIFDSGFPRYEGGQPMSGYRLVSIDLKTGQIRNSLELAGRWGAMPHLYATNDGHVILEQGSLKSLNPDLSDAGPYVDVSHGEIVDMSLDGTTLEWATAPGTTLLDSHTLSPTGKSRSASFPATEGPVAVPTANTAWAQDFPNDKETIALANEQGLRLLFHGNCLGPPHFINAESILLAGCGKIRVIDTNGGLLREAAFGGYASFAGASQDGTRFALSFRDERGDLSVLLYEYFVVYDVLTLHPIATIPISDLPERQSWSAFSPDGLYFATGNPNDLSLYQLPSP